MVPNPFGCTSFPCASYARLVIVLSVRLAKFTVLLTPVNWSVFSALNMSRRTSTFKPWVATKFFDTDRSRLLSGGLRAKKRGVSSPLLPGCGGARHDGLANCRDGSPLQPLPGSQGSAARAFGLPSGSGGVGGPVAGVEKVA